jgi:RNA polymerase sigma-70 factor (ECF subfamily)
LNEKSNATVHGRGNQVAPEDDRELVRRFKEDGDRSAFKELVQRYQQRIFAVAYGIVRDEEAALDIAQETFIRAHRSLVNFQGASSFYSWLYRIATNVSIDYRRANKRAKDHSEYDDRLKVEEEPFQALVTPSYGRSNPAREFEQREVGRLLESAVEQLSEKLKSVFILREVEGLSYQEIADTLEISIGTVMSRLFHARQRLQEFLKPHLADTSLAARLGLAIVDEEPQGGSNGAR